MSRTFHSSEFCVSHDCGREGYEELMQRALVDTPDRVEIVHKSEGWTKEGDHMISVEYIEDERQEKY